MDLSGKAIREVVHPTAAFDQVSPSSEAPDNTSNGQEQSISDTWETSLLNLKNRVDSLDFPRRSLWRVDGCGSGGTQYFVVPIFLPNPPPVRLDVLLQDRQPAELRRQLELPTAFHTKDAERLANLAITRHIIRTLNRWTEASFSSPKDFEKFYKDIPFGSRLIFDNLSLDVSKIRVSVGLNHNLEHRMLDIPGLKELWGPDFVFPEVIDLYDLEVVKILHDSVCLVRIGGKLFIFKALVSGLKYLYHELKTLCSIKPHHNIIARPVHLVRKRGQFGAKQSVVGFTTVYHPKGSLRDIIPPLRIHGQLHLSDQITWSLQIAEGLEHLRSTCKTYYPDLRLDNVVLSATSDVVMVDFEQRGVWCEFAAPEINVIEYMRLLVVETAMPNTVREKYRERLKQLVPNYDTLEGELYTNPEHGFAVSWIALTPAEQEAAEVYMLGRIMWCIFEGVSGPQKAAVWQSYRWESHLEFPEYERTPNAIRDLIDRCTRGRRGNLASVIARLRSRLVLCNESATGQQEEDVKDAARQFWLVELEVAERYLDLRDSEMKRGTWNENHYDRPNLKEVIAALQAYQATIS